MRVSGPAILRVLEADDKTKPLILLFGDIHIAAGRCSFCKEPHCVTIAKLVRTMLDWECTGPLDLYYEDHFNDEVNMDVTSVIQSNLGLFKKPILRRIGDILYPKRSVPLFDVRKELYNYKPFIDKKHKKIVSRSSLRNRAHVVDVRDPFLMRVFCSIISTAKNHVDAYLLWKDTIKLMLYNPNKNLRFVKKNYKDINNHKIQMFERYLKKISKQFQSIDNTTKKNIIEFVSLKSQKPVCFESQMLFDLFKLNMKFGIIDMTVWMQDVYMLCRMLKQSLNNSKIIVSYLGDKHNENIIEFLTRYNGYNITYGNNHSFKYVTGQYQCINIPQNVMNKIKNVCSGKYL